MWVSMKTQLHGTPRKTERKKYVLTTTMIANATMRGTLKLPGKRCLMKISLVSLMLFMVFLAFLNIKCFKFTAGFNENESDIKLLRQFEKFIFY